MKLSTDILEFYTTCSMGCQTRSPRQSDAFSDQFKLHLARWRYHLSPSCHHFPSVPLGIHDENVGW